MATELVAALIAVGGVLASALVSWLIAKQSLVSQLRAVRLENQQVYAAKLQEKRLDAYSELHGAVNEFVRSIQRRQASFEAARALHDLVCSWDAKYSLILGAQATGVMYRFERFLRSIVAAGDEAFAKRITSADSRLKLIRRCFEAEIALKNDLGIYELEFAEPGKRFRSYDQITKALDVGADED